jgi:hypothetical protein
MGAPLGPRYIDVTPRRRHRCRECVALALAWTSLGVAAAVTFPILLAIVVRTGDPVTILLCTPPLLICLAVAVVSGLQAHAYDRGSRHR